LNVAVGTVLDAVQIACFIVIVQLVMLLLIEVVLHQSPVYLHVVDPFYDRQNGGYL